MSPRRLNLIKNSLVLALLLPTAWWIDGSLWQQISGRDVLLCLFSGFIGIGVADTLYFRSLNALGAGQMGIVGNLYSPIMIVLAWLFLGEHMSLRQGTGFALVASGVLVVSLPSRRGEAASPMDWRPLLTAALAIFLMAASIILIKRTLEVHSVWWISTLRIAAGVAALLLFSAWTRWRGHATGAPLALSRRGWGLLILAAFIGQFVSMVLWLYGYKYTSASVASILNESSSVFIVLFAWALLGEPLTRRRLLGIALAFGGVLCMVL